MNLRWGVVIYIYVYKAYYEDEHLHTHHPPTHLHDNPLHANRVCIHSAHTYMTTRCILYTQTTIITATYLAPEYVYSQRYTYYSPDAATLSELLHHRIPVP
jgi:hypothetical protein